MPLAHARAKAARVRKRIIVQITHIRYLSTVHTLNVIVLIAHAMPGAAGSLGTPLKLWATCFLELMEGLFTANMLCVACNEQLCTVHEGSLLLATAAHQKILLSIG